MTRGHSWQFPGEFQWYWIKLAWPCIRQETICCLCSFLIIIGTSHLTNIQMLAMFYPKLCEASQYFPYLCLLQNTNMKLDHHYRPGKNVYIHLAPEIHEWIHGSKNKPANLLVLITNSVCVGHTVLYQIKHQFSMITAYVCIYTDIYIHKLCSLCIYT